MIEAYIQRAIERTKEFRKDAPPYSQPSFSQATAFSSGIPCLARDHYRPSSPMLESRYGMFGRWTNATHGHWLSIGDMEQLWGRPTDQFIQSIIESRQAGESGWPDEASALFRTDRLSLFACSDITNEKIYLLWLECEDEPEFWVYDSNGESRYKNLFTYLKAYLEDDLSATGRSWRVRSSETDAV